MYCPRCNAYNPENVTYCRNCDTRLAVTRKYAGFWRRLAAGILDTIIVAIVGGILAFVLGVFFGVIAGSIAGAVAKSDFFPVFFSTISFFITGIFVLLRWLYFAIMESSSYQATFGKKLIGIKVTDVSGNRVTFMRATVRHLAKILSRIIFYIGYFMIGFTEKKQGLHDIIAGCLVIDDYELSNQ
ncbi:RDD family protein [Methanolobus sp. ZRKC3]|uniref:RDD family protein n=1 Tax=Methanolobus sp. ZRKC3 TaxID=3125786 RepID=UPI003244A700